MPTNISALLTVGTNSGGEDVNGDAVIVGGGTVIASCSDYGLYVLTADGGATNFSADEILLCTNTEWNNADADWECLPICKLRDYYGVKVHLRKR